MNKRINAVRGVLINDGKILCIKNKDVRAGYYDLPGGEIEKDETPLEACVREFKEETNIEVKEAEYKGLLDIITPAGDIISLKIFKVNKFNGNIKYELEENYCYFLDIEELLSKEKVYANTIILDRFFIKLLDQNKEFEIKVNVNEEDKIQSLNFKYI